MPESGVLVLHALEMLHPGVGAAPGVVDLPIRRETPLGWPMVPASTLKGVFRDAFDNSGMREDLFGSERGSRTPRAGALRIADARLLAFPVRARRGTFAWVICPTLLERLNRDLQLAGRNEFVPVPNVPRNGAWCASGCPAEVDGKVYLEEESLDYKGVFDSTNLAAIAPGLDAARIVCVHDEDFSYFVSQCLPIMTRNALDYEVKQVRPKALFQTEVIPPETVFYAPVSFDDARTRGDGKRSAIQLRGEFESRFAPNGCLHVQIGADETIGCGLCEARLHMNNGVEQDAAIA